LDLKENEVAGGWRKLHSGVTKSKNIGAGYVSCMGELKNVYKILVGKPEGRHSIDEMTILKWILRKKDLRMWIGFIWLRICTRGGFL
jgi:hypothetical protein